MRRLLAPLVMLFICCSGSLTPVFGQAQCVISLNMVNNSRYVYASDEECGYVWPFEHSVPFGVWGIDSNVGAKQNADQFDGWWKPCSDLRVDWNSCANDYVKPDSGQRLNFPDAAGLYPYPANGYPFTDSYAWNDTVPLVGGNSRCVDQYSPCGANVYGSAGTSVGVSPVVDYDGDGVVDAGGCLDLNGYEAWVTGNYMSAYELDWNNDDFIGRLYFPDVKVTLRCTPDACFAVGDNNFDGWVDDIANQTSPDYLYPYAYLNDWSELSYATQPGVPTKRFDATIRIGRFSGYYSGPYPCNPYEEQNCWMQGGNWDYNSCSCQYYDPCNQTGPGPHPQPVQPCYAY